MEPGKVLTISHDHRWGKGAFHGLTLVIGHGNSFYSFFARDRKLDLLYEDSMVSGIFFRRGPSHSKTVFYGALKIVQSQLWYGGEDEAW